MQEPITHGKRLIEKIRFSGPLKQHIYCNFWENPCMSICICNSKHCVTQMNNAALLNFCLSSQ